MESHKEELNKLKGEKKSIEKEISELKRKVSTIKEDSRLEFGWSNHIWSIFIIISGLLVYSFTDSLVSLIIFFGFGSYLSFRIEVSNNKLKNTFEKKTNEISSKELKLKKVIEEIEEVERVLLNNRNEILLNSILKLRNELDTDGDNTIDVIQHDNEFMKILKSNQKVILEMEKSENRDFTKQFVKLSNFLVEKEKNLQKVFRRIRDINELKSFEQFRKQLYQQIHFYNILRMNSLQMISSFVEDDRITFYVIYEKFDKLGVWNTNFENQFLFKMDVLNSKMERLISEISNMSYSINTSIGELISITRENTSSVSKQLEKIGSRLDTSNLLNTINTYHTYKTYKLLKK